MAHRQSPSRPHPKSSKTIRQVDLLKSYRKAESFPFPAKEMDVLQMPPGLASSERIAAPEFRRSPFHILRAPGFYLSGAYPYRRSALASYSRCVSGEQGSQPSDLSRMRKFIPTQNSCPKEPPNQPSFLNCNPSLLTSIIKVNHAVAYSPGPNLSPQQ